MYITSGLKTSQVGCVSLCGGVSVFFYVLSLLMHVGFLVRYYSLTSNYFSGKRKFWHSSLPEEVLSATALNVIS